MAAIKCLIILIINAIAQGLKRENLFHKGPIIETVKSLNLFDDLKDFQDLKIKTSITEVWKDFALLKQIPEEDMKQEMKSFIKMNFENRTGLLKTKPRDWTTKSKIVVANPGLSLIVEKSHSFWLSHYRQLEPMVYMNPHLYSFFPVPKPFYVLSTADRELDTRSSYWILQGLLAEVMYESARDLLENLVWLVTKLGYLPERNRVYAASPAPPLLSPMVYDYLQATGDLKFVQEVLPALDQELLFWLEERGLDISCPLGSFLALSTESQPPRREKYHWCVRPEDQSPVRLTKLWWRVQALGKATSRVLSAELTALAEWSSRRLRALHVAVGQTAEADGLVTASRGLLKSVRLVLMHKGKPVDLDLERGRRLSTGPHPAWTGAAVPLKDPISTNGTSTFIEDAAVVMSLAEPNNAVVALLSRPRKKLVEHAIALHLVRRYPDINIAPTPAAHYLGYFSIVHNILSLLSFLIYLFQYYLL